MTIIDFFDPHNQEHIEAYAHLCFVGVWPEWFVLDEVTFPQMWTVLLANKLADCWVQHILNNPA